MKHGFLNHSYTLADSSILISEQKRPKDLKLSEQTTLIEVCFCAKFQVKIRNSVFLVLEEENFKVL
jgi:hypothetical protein